MDKFERIYIAVLEWIYDQPHEELSVEALLEGVVLALQSSGMMLYRVQFGMPVLHPLYATGTYTWHHEEGVTSYLYSLGEDERDAFDKSPIRPIYESGAEEGRHSLSLDAVRQRYSMFELAAKEGATDYFLQLSGFNDRSSSPMTTAKGPSLANREGVVLSWISMAPQGFSAAEIDLLRRLKNPIAAELRAIAHRQLVKDLLHAYLGRYSADRVYSGQIHRGDGDEIDAVIFFCDLRGSSKIAEQYDLPGFLSVLNDYYEITAGSVIAHGGEVLRYIGDASLAIFPIHRYSSVEDACAVALSSAREAMRRGVQMNREREKVGEVDIEFGIGLHVGRVLYGNIGTRDRLEFTVIGQAANEAARIEAKCKELKETLLVSHTFAETTEGPWKSHGDFTLRNIGKPIEILSLAG